jgi:4-hydroxybenzoate polyprenyltransferase/phosphoserine phosphatase
MTGSIPLCVDLDGTLVRSDLLHEGCVALLKQSPLMVLALPIWLASGKATLKTRLAERVDPDYATLPYRQPLLEFLKGEKIRGRKLVLATASPASYADGVASHLGLFDEVLATETTNLSGLAKARVLEARFGRGGFDYVGDSSKDLPVWQAARKAYLADVSDSLRGRVKAVAEVAAPEFTEPRAGIRVLLKGIRIHQWLKNVLVFVPLLAAHRFIESQLLLQALLAFLCFGLCASSVYVLNDLLDLPADRSHPRKRERPFASGALSIPTGIALCLALLATGLLLTTQLPSLFGIVLVGYLLTTTAYSFWLKQRVVVDVMVLASLYTFRIVAGGAATGVPLSFWLLAFSLFLFLSLAMVKRCSELVLMEALGNERSAGRGYRPADSAMLMSMGTSSGYIAVLVLALYIDNPDVGELYQEPLVLWLTIPMLLYWITRVWMKTQRGEMHDDPVVFAATDPISLLLGALLALSFLAAAVV